MPVVIYQKQPGGMIAQGNRSISTFPSGLVRVEETFVCATKDAAEVRSNIQPESAFPSGNYPAIDGLYVFPDAQETQNPNGFTEFNVTGYGRTSTELKNIKIGANRNVYGGLLVSVYRVDGEIVIPRGSGLAYSDLGIAPQFSGIKSVDLYNMQYGEITDYTPIQVRDFKYLDWNGDERFLQTTIYKAQLNKTWSQLHFTISSPVILVTGQTNYGKFTHLEITTSPTMGFYNPTLQQNT